MNIMNSKSEEELELLALSFTASQSHFGSVKTIELDQGGKNKSVTLANKHDFVQKLYSWHLTGEQLKKKANFNIMWLDYHELLNRLHPSTVGVLVYGVYFHHTCLSDF